MACLSRKRKHKCRWSKRERKAKALNEQLNMYDSQETQWQPTKRIKNNKIDAIVEYMQCATHTLAAAAAAAVNGMHSQNNTMEMKCITLAHYYDGLVNKMLTKLQTFSNVPHN